MQDNGNSYKAGKDAMGDYFYVDILCCYCYLYTFPDGFGVFAQIMSGRSHMQLPIANRDVNLSQGRRKASFPFCILHDFF